MRSVFIAVMLLGAMQVGAQEETEALVPDFPQQQSARDLLTACASSSISNLGRSRRKYCAGFVSGVEEAIRFKSQLLGADSHICPPGAITAQQLADVYIKYANNKATELDKPAVEVVFKALKQAFPCP